MTDRNRDDGAIAILVAVLAVVMFGFGAIVVDLGYARTVSQRAQDSADAAALAGVPDLDACTRRRCRAATTAIMSSAGENFDSTSSEWSSCNATAPVGGNLSAVTWRQRRSGTTCIQYGFQGGDSQPSLVFVSLPPRDSSSFFGGIFGYQGTSIGASSVAGLVATQVPPCALCVLDALTTNGGSVDVAGGGSIYSTRALGSAGRVTVINSGGIYLTNGPPSGATFDPAPVVTDQRIRDPLASGTNGGGNDKGLKRCPASGKLSPGRYKEEITIDVPCELTSGSYVFEDEVHVIDGGHLFGTGVTVTLADDHGDLSIDGSGFVTLAGPALNEDLTLVSDNDNSLQVSTDGLGLDVTGAVYLPDAELRLLSGSVRVIGTTVSRDVTVATGQLFVQSPGVAAVRQQGRSDPGLVR